jgi:hypothetical protein
MKKSTTVSDEACQEAVRNGGYYWRGSWMPMTYHLTSWVKKPLLGREGANITLHQPGNDAETGGDYGAEGFIRSAVG